MDNYELLKEIKENPKIIEKMNNNQRHDIAFKTAAINENPAAIYFGLLNGNPEQDSVIFSKAMLYNPNIGKNNFYGQNKEYIENLCSQNDVFESFFANVKAEYNMKNSVPWNYEAILNDGRFRDKETVVELIKKNPVEYIRLPIERKTDRDIVLAMLENINDIPSFSKPKDFLKTIQRIFREQKVMAKAKITVEDVFEIGKKNIFLGTFYQKGIIEKFNNEIKTRKEEIQIAKQKGEKPPKLSGVLKILKENPGLALISGCYNPGNTDKILNAIISETKDIRSFLILTENIRKKINEEIILPKDATLEEQRFYNIKSERQKALVDFFNNPKNFDNIDLTNIPIDFLKLCGPDVLSDYGFVENALKYQKNVFPIIDKTYHANESVAINFLKIAGKNYRLLNDILKEEPEIIKTALSKYAGMYYYLPKFQKENVEYAKIAIQKDKWSYFLMPDKMKTNEEILEAMNDGEEKNPLLEECFGIHSKHLGDKINSLQANAELFKELIKADPTMILSVPKENATKNLWKDAIELNSELYREAPGNIKKDAEIIKTVIKNKKQENSR